MEGTWRSGNAGATPTASCPRALGSSWDCHGNALSERRNRPGVSGRCSWDEWHPSCSGVRRGLPASFPKETRGGCALCGMTAAGAAGGSPFCPWLTQQLSLLWPLLPTTSKSLLQQQLLTEARALLPQGRRAGFLSRTASALGGTAGPEAPAEAPGHGWDEARPTERQDPGMNLPEGRGAAHGPGHSPGG